MFRFRYAEIRVQYCGSSRDLEAKASVEHSAATGRL
jgi:hypothetical protein